MKGKTRGMDTVKGIKADKEGYRDEGTRINVGQKGRETMENE